MNNLNVRITMAVVGIAAASLLGPVSQQLHTAKGSMPRKPKRLIGLKRSGAQACIRTTVVGCPAAMNGNCTASYAANDSQQKTQARRIHRWMVPIAAAPLLLTSATGSLYSVLLEHGIDAFWLIKLHTGNLGWINLNPFTPFFWGS